MSYRRLNNLFGWGVALVALVTYLLTMERTVSYWDCGEFISCAYKLQVGHSPGAPFFMLLQRLFGMFAENGLTAGPSKNAALLINSMSALVSAGTILFLFWTITHYARRLVLGTGSTYATLPTRGQTVSILGAGIVGALAYTFSDTFWFSAVESEVYGTSSFFTALTFWCILKWDREAEIAAAAPASTRAGNPDRWLVFIAYLIGISVAVHLLNLLCIPAIGLVYYFRRYKPTPAGTAIAFAISCVALGIVQFGILQGIPVLASAFELAAVNSFGMPFDTGSIAFLALLVGLLAWGIWWARKRAKYSLHLSLLCTAFVVIGFSSYLLAIIRSRADVPIDMTNPDNTFSLTSYLKREQFGQQPLLYGPDFDAALVDIKSSGTTWWPTKEGGKDKYIAVGEKPKYVFEEGKQRFFPRIWDGQDPNHVSFYRQWNNLAEGERPSGADNMRYFMGYQMGWMWWRYFMWNYSGRQNDFEGQGGPKDGNWITGIGFLDRAMGRGDLDKMPDGYRNNPARNSYFLLPFALGVAGLIYQFNRNRRDGAVLFTLFFLTGIAIGIYLNMTPLQPRERDYAFAGSTYAFAIWIGLGVLALQHLLQRGIKNSATAAGLATAASLLAVPVLMAVQNWDDHDRSHKTLALSTAINTLESCAPNAVLFTYGDNETYPLWYAQEVEGIRPDIRIINTSLLGIDWYIDQLNHAANKSAPVPMAWSQKAYRGDARNYVPYSAERGAPEGQFFPLKQVVEIFSSDDPRYQIPTQSGKSINFLPTKNFSLPIPDAAGMTALGKPADTGAAAAVLPAADLRFSITKGTLVKDELAQLAIIAGVADGGWKRPLYWSNLQELSGMGELRDYMRQEGTVYRLMPYKVQPRVQPGPGDGGFVDVEKSLQLFTKTYTYGNAAKGVYFDEKNRMMFAPYRIASARLADELTLANRKPEALAVLDRVMKEIPSRAYAHDVSVVGIMLAYYRAGAPDKARKLALAVSKAAEDDMNWVSTLSSGGQESMQGEVQRDVQIVAEVTRLASQMADKQTADELTQKLNAMATRAEREMGIRFQ